MKDFDNMRKFSSYLTEMVAELPAYEKKWGEFGAKMLEKEAKDKIGHLNEGWAPLAESTKKDKERLGYVFNADYNPLYREGDLRESIFGYYNAELKRLYLGSFSQIMVYQAEGTIHIPPRDPLGPTMAQALPTLGLSLGQMFISWLELKPFTPRSATYGRSI